MSTSHNILIRLLESLDVRHTKTYSSKFYDEHPYKTSLYGIKKMLEDYGVSSEGIRLKNKEVIRQLGTPFLAHAGNDFVIVKSAKGDKVEYEWNGELVRVDYDAFCKMWDGVVLLMEASEESGEPSYADHRKEERRENFKGACFILSLIAFLASGFGAVWSRQSIWAVPLMVCYGGGMWLSFMLLMKQMHKHVGVADRICTLMKKSSCNDVLDSDGAKFLGMVSWSEVGFGYFTAGFALTVLHPSCWPWLALMAFASLLYALWSVWYQKRRVRQWCPLCLLVQVVSVVLAVVHGIRFHAAPSISFLWPDLFVVIGACVSAILATSYVVKHVSASSRERRWKYALRAFKLRGDVFGFLLQQEKQYDLASASTIFFGHPEGTHLVTVLSNPYCNPCALMHKKLAALVEKGFCVQYVFAAFSETLENTNRLLIAAYKKYGAERSLEIFSKWYDGGKSEQEAFFEHYDLDAAAAEVEEEMQRHKVWREAAQFTGTPTILVDGHLLPQAYNMDDVAQL